MTVDYLHAYAIPAALALLPARMTSPEARTLLLAIALQESDCQARRQIVDGGKDGPARGFWQFERDGAVHGVLTHPRTRDHARAVLDALAYRDHSELSVWLAIEHNDVLAAAFARLNLWWLPLRLPTLDEPEFGYEQYIQAWQPGRAKPDRWPIRWRAAVAIEAQGRQQ